MVSGSDRCEQPPQEANLVIELCLQWKYLNHIVYCELCKIGQWKTPGMLNIDPHMYTSYNAS